MIGEKSTDWTYTFTDEGRQYREVTSWTEKHFAQSKAAETRRIPGFSNIRVVTVSQAKNLPTYGQQ